MNTRTAIAGLLFFGTFAAATPAMAASDNKGQVCGSLLGIGLVYCDSTTPICTNAANQSCSACYTDQQCVTAAAHAAPGNTIASTCALNGANAGQCFTCNGDFGSSAAKACPSKSFGVCDTDLGSLAGHCTQCDSTSNPSDPTMASTVCSNPLAPRCVKELGVCGCGPSTGCLTGSMCEGGDAAVPGECVSSTSCTPSSCSGMTNGICDPSLHTCVQCEIPSDCDAGATCTAMKVCQAIDTSLPDAGRSDGGNTGSTDGGTTMDDGGTSTGSTDGGPGLLADGGAIGPEEGDATLNGGNVTYPYGHVEGGGCSVIPSSDSAGAAASAFVTGLAALAGILSIRTRRRRSGEDRSR